MYSFLIFLILLTKNTNALNNDTILVISELNAHVALECHVPSNITTQVQLYWLVTSNKTGSYEVEPIDDKYSIAIDWKLNISNLDLSDEEYYSCIYINTNQELVILSRYLIFLKRKPSLGIFINKNLINNNSIFNVSIGISYNLACVSTDSRPNVTLKLYNGQSKQDFQELKSILIQLKQEFSECDENLLCRNSLIYQFQIINDSFIKNLTCEATNNTYGINISKDVSFELIKETPKYEGFLADSQLVSEFVSNSIKLECNVTLLNFTLFWLVTINKTQLAEIEQVDGKYTLVENNRLLVINSIDLYDEEYYLCGYFNQQQDFIFIQKYFLFVKYEPQVAIFLNQNLINSSVNQELVTGVQYSLACVSIDSRPQIELELYDAKTNLSFDNLNEIEIFTRQLFSNCSNDNVCKASLIYQFEIKENSFPTSLVCKAHNGTLNIYKQEVASFRLKSDGELGATLISAFIGESIQLDCSNESSIIWLASENQMGLFEIDSVNNKYSIALNGQLNISNIDLNDEEYYYCGYFKTQLDFVLLQKYLLYVKQLPSIGIFFNKLEISNGTSIQLNDTSEMIYSLACVSEESRPEVLLSIFETNTKLNFDNLTQIQIELKQHVFNCTFDGFCLFALIYQFQIKSDVSFAYDLTCSAFNSTTPFEMKVVKSLSILYDKKGSYNSIETQIISAFIDQSIQLECNLNALPVNTSFYWLSTQNKTGFYEIDQVNDKYAISLSSGQLNITYLSLLDEEFYYCGYLNAQADLIFLSSFFLFIKQNPVIGVFVDKKEIFNGEVVKLTLNKTYTLACISKESRPGVSLSLFDPQTSTNFDNLTNISIESKQTSDTCDTSGFCSLSLIYQFKVFDALNWSTLVCKAENTTKSYEIEVKTQIKVIYSSNNQSFVSKFSGESIEFKCDLSMYPSNVTNFWLSTENKVGLYEIESVKGKYLIVNNTLQISDIDSNDEEYYYCYVSFNNELIQISQYFLFVKELPDLGFFLDKKQLSDSIEVPLVLNKSYNLACIAKDSRPEVSLKIMDTRRNVNFDDFSSVVIESKQYNTNCDQNSYCQASLIYQFVILNDSFDDIKSLSCIAENLTEPYEMSINVSIKINFRKNDADSFALIIEFIYESIQLECELFLNDTDYLWLFAKNLSMDYFIIDPIENKYSYLANKSLLISNLDTNDEGYYKCVSLESNTDWILESKYFLFIKKLPELALFFEQIQLNSSTIIKINKNQSYSFACVADSSRPEVNLVLFDTSSGQTFDDITSVLIEAKQLVTNCDENGFCKSALIYQFIVIDNSFSQVTSLTCNAFNLTRPFNMTTSTSTSVEYTNEEPQIKSQLIAEFISRTVVLDCNLAGMSMNSSFTWLTSENKTGLYEIEPIEGKYSILLDGKLVVSNVDLEDEEYYSCGYFKTPTKFILLSSYFLFVKQEPLIFIFLNENLVEDNLIFRPNQAYTLACISQDSRPQVELRLYDDQSKTSFDNFSSVSILSKQASYECNEKLFCKASLIYQFLINNDSFKQINSLTCEALNETKAYAMSTKLDVKVNYTETSTCVENFCNSNGICMLNNASQTPYCVCYPGYLGAKCDRYEECTIFIFCQNNGTCFKSGNRYLCNCTGTGYTGTFCTQLGVRPMCENGGVYDERLKRCRCRQGFSGTNCSVRDVCSLGPCINGGSCTSFDGTSNFFCECTPEFTGNQCQTQLCDDTNAELCSKLKNNCFNQYLGTIPVYLYCKKTCNQCGNEQCADVRTGKFCNEAKLNNICSILSIFYPTYCPKTCGDC